mmetsp:Transcript_30191/g.48400  ORF Transcript_30191/g.48400 Transcript_30191/m.48400 type:complete len:202 (-) Transcript_30191:96-701(-)
MRASERNERGRRVAIVIRGEKILEYTIPSFIPSWLVQVDDPSVFDSTVGDFEPTFGPPPLSEDLSKSPENLSKSPKGALRSPRDLSGSQSDLSRSPENRSECGEEGVENIGGDAADGSRAKTKSTVFNWTITEMYKPPRKNRGTFRKISRDSSEISRPGSSGSSVGIGVGGSLVLGLYLLAYILINVLGLVKDMEGMDPFG